MAHLFLAKKIINPKILNVKQIFLVDGNWAEWTTWDECSKSCGSGVQRRIRTCSNPASAGDGKSCVGQPSEERDCNTNECPSTYLMSRALS